MSEVYFVGDVVELRLKSGREIIGKISRISGAEINKASVDVGGVDYSIHSFMDCVNIGQDSEDICLFVEGAR